MLCGYSLARCLAGPEVAVDDNGTDPARIGDREPGTRFPPRYRGAFARDVAVSREHASGRGALSQSARDMLERKLGPQAASRLIDCAERMAAAASRSDA